MKLLRVLLSFILWILINTERASSQVQNQANIDAGVAFSAIDFIAFSQFSFLSERIRQINDGPPPYHVFPAFNLTAEYGTGKRSMLGLAVTYQAIDVYPNYPGLVPPNAVEKVSRTNFALRYLYFFN